MREFTPHYSYIRSNALASDVARHLKCTQLLLYRKTIIYTSSWLTERYFYTPPPCAKIKRKKGEKS